MAKNRFTEADIAKFKVVGGAGNKAAAKPSPKKNKFGAIKTPDPDTGLMVDSKQEVKDRQAYKAMLVSKEIAIYIPQATVFVGHDVESKAVFYTADHLAIRLVDGVPQIEISDTKGFETPEFKKKWREVQKKLPWIKWVLLFGGKPQPSKTKSVKPTKRST